MNFWDILEIDPTENVSIVKKAYAKKLKLHHPEDDPEGYQKLREAYDSALKYLKNNKNKQTINSSNKEKIEVPEIIFKEDNLINDKQAIPNFNILEELNEKPLSFEEIVEEFIDKAQALYNDFFSRINIENWITLLNSEAMWYMGDKKLLSNKMIEFLIENHYFSGNIWNLFGNNFNWMEQTDYLYGKYDESFINYLEKQINDNNGLRYSYFKEGQVFDYDTFLRYREEAFEALLNDDFEYAEECINISYNIYAEDSDLLLMKGKCYVHSGELEKALQIFEYVVQKDTEDIFARFCRAKVLYDKGQMSSALEDCKYLEAQNFDNVDFLLLFAKCYFKLEKFHEAKELLLKILEVDSWNIEVKGLLKQINLQLSHKFKEELKKNKRDKKIKNDLDKLYKELGILVPKEIIKKLSYIMLRRITACMLLLLIQVIIVHSAMKNLNIKDPTSLKSTIQFIMLKDSSHPIKNMDDINKLPVELSTVEGKLTDAHFLDLYRIPQKDKDGNITNIYLPLKEAEEKDVFKDMNGYVCFGNLDNKKVIAIVDYKQAQQAYNTKTIDFKGAIRYMEADDLLNEVKKRYTTNIFETLFITDKFIDTEFDVSNAREKALSIDAILLFIQVTLIIQGLLSGYMLVKANRKKMVS